MSEEERLSRREWRLRNGGDKPYAPETVSTPLPWGLAPEAEAAPAAVEPIAAPEPAPAPEPVIIPAATPAVEFVSPDWETPSLPESAAPAIQAATPEFARPFEPAARVVPAPLPVTPDWDKVLENVTPAFDTFKTVPDAWGDLGGAEEKWDPDAIVALDDDVLPEPPRFMLGFRNAVDRFLGRKAYDPVAATPDMFDERAADAEPAFEETVTVGAAPAEAPVSKRDLARQAKADAKAAKAAERECRAAEKAAKKNKPVAGDTEDAGDVTVSEELSDASAPAWETAAPAFDAFETPAADQAPAEDKPAKTSWKERRAAKKAAADAPALDADGDVAWTEDTEPKPLSKREQRAAEKAAKKAEAEAEKAAKESAAFSGIELDEPKKLTSAEKKAKKEDAKVKALAEKKRAQFKAKEEKTLEIKRKREAMDEEKLLANEQRVKAKMDKKAQMEWRKLQKRREAIKKNGGKEGFWQGTSKPKTLDIANAVRSLAIILETSPAEYDAVKMMAEEFAGNRIGDAFDRITDRLLLENMTLVDAFAPEDLFPPVVHNMLRVGEKTAKPAAALRTAVELMDESNDNSRELRFAVAQPLVIALLSLATLFAVAWMVMPVFVTLYEQLNMPIGMFTNVVLVFSEVTKYVCIALLTLTLFTVVWWFGWGRSDLRVRIAIDRYKMAAPLIGKSHQTSEAFQMFNTLDSYLSVGSTEREALLATANATENRAIRRHLRMISNGLTRGEKTFAQFLDDEMFPRLARSILATGQRSGQTLQSIKNLRSVYEKESKIAGKQSVESVSNVVSVVSTVLFSTTAILVTIPPLEIFGATLSYSGG